MSKDNVLKILGKNMHRIRLKKKISLQDLADKLNINIEILCKFESGEYTGLCIPLYINQFADALDVSFEDITYGIHFVEN